MSLQVRHIKRDKSYRKRCELSHFRNLKPVTTTPALPPALVIALDRPFFDILKFILVSEVWGNKTKEMSYSLLSLKMISFVLFPQASQPRMNLIHRNWSIVPILQIA